MAVAFWYIILPSLLVAWFYIDLAARKDNIQVEANGSLDNLKVSWHTVNAAIRVLVFGGYGVGYVLLGWLAGDLVLGLALAAAYEVLAAAGFWVWFDRRLNGYRGKELVYVSREPDAALSDRLIVFLADRTPLPEPGKTAPIVKLTCLGLALICFGWLALNMFRALSDTPAPF